MACRAISAGALYGGFSALTEKLALTGVIALAVVLGVGGGIIRDTLLQTGPPAALTEPVFVPATIVAGLLSILVARRFDRIRWVLVPLDALAVGIYAVVGVDKALSAGLPIVGSVLVGVLSGTGGSMLHDVLLGRPAALLRPGILLGAAAGSGATVYAIAVSLDGFPVVWAPAAIALITLTRIGAVRYGWSIGEVRPVGARHRTTAVTDPWHGPDDQTPGTTHSDAP